MRKTGYYFVFILLVAVQMLICNYLNLSAWLMLSILPVMILCVPLRLPCIFFIFGVERRGECAIIRAAGGDCV